MNNVADPEKSTLRGLSGFKSVKLINPVAEYTGDCTSLGSAVLHCPNCSEGRYTQILCPECLKKGYSVPLKLLYNPRCGGKKEQFILQCQRYVSVEDKLKQERKQGYLIPLSKICDFCINILEEDGITPTDELQAVGGLSEMSKNWARSKRKLMHLRESLKETEKD